MIFSIVDFVLFYAFKLKQLFLRKLIALHIFKSSFIWQLAHLENGSIPHLQRSFFLKKKYWQNFIVIHKDSRIVENVRHYSQIERKRFSMIFSWKTLNIFHTLCMKWTFFQMFLKIIWINFYIELKSWNVHFCSGYGDPGLRQSIMRTNQTSQIVRNNNSINQVIVSQMSQKMMNLLFSYWDVDLCNKYSILKIRDNKMNFHKILVYRSWSPPKVNIVASPSSYLSTFLKRAVHKF